jgi:acyl carrier protein
MPEDSRIDPATPLQDLGFDSMMAVEMGNALSAAVGFKLSATVGFDHPTPGALAGFLAEKLLPQVGEGAAAAAGPATATVKETAIADDLAMRTRLETEDDLAEVDDDDLGRSLDEELNMPIYLAKSDGN